jgi:hypothetical protein
VKTPRPIEEPGTLTRRSKDPRPLRLGVAVKYGRDAEDYIGQVAYIFSTARLERTHSPKLVARASSENSIRLTLDNV